MPRHDALGIVARDLAVLAASDRRAILRALDRDDRDRMAAAMRGETVASVGRADRDGDARHSPWFDGLIAVARAGGDGAITTAAGAALLEAVGARRGDMPTANGRSLLQAAGGLFGQGRAR